MEANSSKKYLLNFSDPSLHRDLKILSVKRDVPINSLILNFVRDGLKNEDIEKVGRSGRS